MDTNNKEEFEDVEKEIRTRFSLLPEDMQKTLVSSEYQMKLYDIAKKEKLTYEQLGTLELEATMVMIGMTEPKEFATELRNALAISDELSKSIVDEINTEVFAPIRDSLKKVYAAKEQADKAIEDGLNGVEGEESGESAQADRNVLSNAGIDIIPTAAQVTPEKEKDILSISREEASRNDLLKNIETPPAGNTSAASMVLAKLKNEFAIPSETNDHTLQKMTSDDSRKGAGNSGTTSKGSEDPYREKV